MIVSGDSAVGLSIVIGPGGCHVGVNEIGDKLVNRCD